MAIAYKSAGAGAGTETSGAALSPACPAAVDANDILVAHVVYLDNTTNPTLPAGWTLLFPDPTDITVGSGLGTGTPTGRAWAFGKIAVGDEDGDAISFGTNGGTSGRLARIYSFSGYVSGTITDVIPAASFTANSSEQDPVIQAVTTTVAGAKAVALVSQDDDNSHAGLGDVTGGTWAEAVADYVNTTVGAQGAKLQIQVGTPTSDPGTISGGTVAGTNDENNTLCFEIRPNAPVVEIPGSGAMGVRAPALAASGLLVFLGTAALAVAQPSVSGTGIILVPVTGTAALTVPAPDVAGTGTLQFTASGALLVTPPSVSGTGTETFSAIGALRAFAAVSGTGSADVPIDGDVALSVSVSLSGTGDLTFSASGAVTVDAPGLAGTGGQEFAGSASLTAQVDVSGIGTLTFDASGALGVDAPVLAGSGTHTPDSPDPEGSAALTVSVRLSGSGFIPQPEGGGAGTTGGNGHSYSRTNQGAMRTAITSGRTQTEIG